MDIFEGADWVADPRRLADIYVFAYHAIFDDKADHCDPRQWGFHVTLANRLPPGKSISLAKVGSLSEQVGWEDLREAVEALRILTTKVENSGANSVPDATRIF